MFARITPRFSKVAIIGSYLILTALGLSFNIIYGDINDPSVVFLCVLCGWIGLWATIATPVYFHTLLLPLFLVLPANIYLQVNFQQTVTPHHIGIVTESSIRETLEFIGTNGAVFIASELLMLLWWATLQKILLVRPVLVWSGVTRWMSLICIGVIFACSTYETLCKQPINVIASDSSVGTTKYSDKFPVAPFSNETFEQAWPFNVYLAGYTFVSEQRYAVKLRSMNEGFKFGAISKVPPQEQRTIVIVLGESGRFDRWGLNGYKRSTTPELGKEKNIVMLDNMITPVTATRLSVPIIMTRKTAEQSTSPGFSEKSVITAMKEAGYKTFWLSNQLSFGKFDTPISAIANEADVVQYVNLGSIASKSSFDEVLLSPLSQAVSDTSPKKLIILHTIGHHWNYAERYPKTFDHWKPSLFDIKNPPFNDLKSKERMNNSYDNSVLYTDTVLSKIIEKLKHQKSPTALIYTADHGQVLFDGTCKYAFHGKNTKFEFHIPAFVWLSDEYRIKAENKFGNLIKHKSSKLSTENIFHSVLDLAFVEYPGQHLEKSIFSETFRPGRRVVDSKGWVDYDAAEFVGDCQEVSAGTYGLAPNDKSLSERID